MNKASIVLFIVVGFFLMQPDPAYGQKAEGKLGGDCFSMTPRSSFEDKSCSPVKVDLSFYDCKTGTAQSKVKGVYARFECHTKNKKLKYWRDNTMYYGDLEKRDTGYVVLETYSMVYGIQDKSTGIVSPAAAVAVENLTHTDPHIQLAESDNVKASSLVPVLSGAGTEDSSAASAEDALALPGSTAAATPSPTPTASPTVAATPIPNASPAVAPSPATVVINPDVKKIVDSIKLSGLVDFYYLYNFNLPAPTTTGSLNQPTTTSTTPGVTPTGNVAYLPYMYHDQFTVNLAELTLKKETDPVGFRIDLAFGPEATWFSGGQTTLDNNSTNIAQAYLTYKTPWDIKITAGKFAALLGYESHYSNENYNYTFSYGHVWATPTWHNGVILTRVFGDFLTLDAYFVNGWNTFYENNASKSIGVRALLKVKDSLSVTLGALSGNETPVGGADQRMATEGVVSWSGIKGLEVVGDFIYDTETISGGTPRQVASIAGYAKYQIIPNLALAGRYEVYFDDSLFSSGLRMATPNPATAQVINAVTGTLDYKAADQLHFKLEYRTDATNAATTPYTNSSGQSVSSQSLAIVNANVTF